MSRFNTVHPGSPRLSTIVTWFYNSSSLITKPGWNGPLDIDSERSTILHNGHHRITSDTVYQTSVSLFACQRLNSPECNYRDYRVQLQRLPTDMPVNAAAVQKIITCLHAGLKIGATWMTLYMTLMVHAWVGMDAWEGPRGTIWVPVSGLLWVWNHEQHQLG